VSGFAYTFPGLLPIGIGEPLPDGITPAKLDHKAEGLDHLLAQYKEKPRLEAVLSAFLTQVQELENAFYQLWTRRLLQTATGKNLDTLGQILDEPRAGRSDANYRAILAVKILAISSDGQAEQLYSIARAMVGESIPLSLTEYFPGAVLLQVLGPFPLSVEEAFRILSRAKAAGVRLSLVYLLTEADEAFTMGAVGDPPSALLGFGNTLDAGAGGAFAGVRG
jgi:hypothetical protein